MQVLKDNIHAHTNLRYHKNFKNTAVNRSLENNLESSSNDVDKIKIPKSLIRHRTNKSNDFSWPFHIKIPSVDQILARILENSASPVKNRSISRTEEPAPIFKIRLSSKIDLLQKPKNKVPSKNHFRSASPMKPFNDRMSQLRRIINK
jgi:hypothetical protein